MSIAILSQGTLFKQAIAASPTNFTTVPEVIKLNCPNQKFDLLDVTSHDSSGGFREYIPGLIDGENCTAEFNFVPTNAVHQALRTEALARNKDQWEIIFPGGGSGDQLAFAGYVVGLAPVADTGQTLKNTVTVKATGVQTWT